MHIYMISLIQQQKLKENLREVCIIKHGMPNSDQYLFTDKGPESSIEFDFRLEFSDENHITVATNDCIQQQDIEEEEEGHGVSSTDESAVKKEDEEEEGHGVSSTDETAAKKEEEECVSSYTNDDDDSFLKKELKIQQSLGDQCGDELDENDDGFRTPTSLEHKIPVIQQCPPAPKKAKSSPSSKKRKPSSNIHRLIRFDLFKEMETSLFIPVPPACLLVDDLGCKIIKKAKGNNTK